MFWTAADFAQKYRTYYGTNFNDYSLGTIETTNTFRRFEFVSPWKARPERWFFAVSTIVDDVRESELLFSHWPPCPKILSKVKISWDDPGVVVLETCDNYFEPYSVSIGDELEWFFPEWKPLPAVNGTEVSFPVDGSFRLYRDSAGVRMLKIEPVYQPDPRDF